MSSLTTLVVLAVWMYTAVVFLRSRRRGVAQLPAPRDLLFVVVIPCLNEELVLEASLQRLMAIPEPNLAVLVVDDGSEDATAAVARRFDPARVWLLQRRLPDARRGKGEALNAAFRHLLASPLLRGRDPASVVVMILDADGRLQANAFHEVAPYFADPRTGAVQIGVRMYNADQGLLCRMQDFEFVTFTEIFQRGRQRLGSVGLGGNGQFTRLTALQSLGESPWTACLTEDLDLGLRLWARGWLNNFCPRTYVSQQAVTSLRRLVRQRARWFQGHMQCWRRLPMVVTADCPLATRLDLVQHLLAPALVLIMALPLAAFVVGATAMLVAAPLPTVHALLASHGALVLVWYVLALGLAPAYGYAYWLHARRYNLLRSVALAHLFCLYSYLWLVAGWMAVGRVARRQRGWAKTARVVDAGPPMPARSDGPARHARARS